MSETCRSSDFSLQQILCKHIIQIMLTMAGIVMGTCAVTLLVFEESVKAAGIYHSTKAIVLLAVWAAAQTAYMILFSIRISFLRQRRHFFPPPPSALPPAAHYVLRTLTGVLLFVMLPVTVAHITHSGPALEDSAVYLPFVASLSAFVNSLIGNRYSPRHYTSQQEEFMTLMRSTGRLYPSTPGYGTTGHMCCRMPYQQDKEHFSVAEIVESTVEGAAEGTADAATSNIV